MSDNPTNTDLPAAPGQVTDLQAAVALGADCEALLNTSVGQHLMQRARDEMLDAVNRMRNVDPFGPREDIAAAQNAVRVPELFIVWISQAIEEGKSAKAQLDQRDLEPNDPV